MRILLLILCLFFASPSFASDIFGFLMPGCQLILGVPVEYQDGELTILDVKGATKSIPVENINGIAHYVLQEGPFDFSEVPDETYKFAKKFEIKETDIILRGFPYQFIDGTIFILDIKGSRQVFGREEIGRVKSGEHWNSKVTNGHVLPELNLPVGISECTKTRKGLMPVRFLADKIQILEMITEWEKGFRELNDLAERSDFYPRPFLFDRHDRFGFIFFNFDAPKQQELLPVRYSFSNGDDFRFQGETSFGGGYDQIGPRALPMNLVATHLKFHFLNASFEGNLNGMAVGSSYYTKGDISLYAQEKPTEALSDIAFNHLALIGFDWRQFGFSFGPMFPTFYIQAGPESREATPQKSVPVVRVTWTNDFIKLKISGATGAINAKSDLNKKSTVLIGEAGDDAFADNYRINFKYIRPSVEWDLSQDMKLSFDLIWVKWDYSESLNGKDLDLKANQLSALMAIRRDFSDYVSLGLNFLLIRPDDKANYEGQSFHRTAQNFNLGGTFEFLF
jgi:hypothetical protein